MIMAGISNPLQGWLMLPDGRYMRQYRYKEEAKARKTAFRAKECSILKVEVEYKISEADPDKGYWWVTLIHGAMPNKQQQEHITG